MVNIPCVPLRAGVRGRIRPGPDLRQLQARAGAGTGRQTLWEGVWVREGFTEEGRASWTRKDEHGPARWRDRAEETDHMRP